MIITSNSNREFTVGKCKDNKMAKWNEKVEKPVKIKIDGVEYTVYANEEKSDYIYFMKSAVPRDHKDFQALYIWTKDTKNAVHGFGFLTEKAFKVKAKAVKPAKEAKEVKEVVKTEAKTPAAKTGKQKKESMGAADARKANERAAASKVPTPAEAPKHIPTINGAPAGESTAPQA